MSFMRAVAQACRRKVFPHNAPESAQNFATKKPGSHDGSRVLLIALILIPPHLRAADSLSSRLAFAKPSSGSALACTGLQRECRDTQPAHHSARSA
jgi:hypothetical protein